MNQPKSLYPKQLIRPMAKTSLEAGGYPPPGSIWPPVLRRLWPAPYRSAVGLKLDGAVSHHEGGPETGFLARVYVSLKPTVNDPPGLTIADGLRHLGFNSVRSVRAGKYVEIRLSATSPEDARRQVDSMCDKLLANPVIETYRFDVEAEPGA